MSFCLGWNSLFDHITLFKLYMQVAACSRTTQPVWILSGWNYRLKQFCISGAGLKLTELTPNTLRTEANDPRQRCSVWVPVGCGILGTDHAEWPRSSGFMAILHDCEEALVTVKVQGDLGQKRGLPAPSLRKV